jgi:hypothetical protein
MKKAFMLSLVLLTGGALLFADTSVEFTTGEPHRTAEFGIDAGGYMANNLMRLTDIFNVRRTVAIDLTGEAVRELFVAAGAEADVSFNMNFRNGYGFSVFAGVDGSFYGTLSESLVRLLSRGNIETGSFKGDLTAGGSVFAEAGLKGAGKFDRLRLAVKPAVFMPIIFVPAPQAYYSVEFIDNGVKAQALFDLNVYSAIALGEEPAPFPGQDANDAFPIGFDFSLGAEYGLLPGKLDIGSSISHIPMIPAKMTHRMHVSTEYTLETGILFFGDNQDTEAVEMPDPEVVTTYDNDSSFYVFRPFRYNFYVNYMPADTGLFVIRPSLGFSFLSVFNYEFCFNAGLEGQINILKIFSTALFAGYVERLWVYDFRFALNFHVMELLLGVSLRGTNLANAFGTRGLGLSLGLRFGY